MSRSWSIRSKIVVLVAVPLTAMLALWAFATVLTAGPALNLLSAQTLSEAVGEPGVALVGEIQKERRLTAEFLADAETDPAALAAQRVATDRAAERFRVTALDEETRSSASGTLKSRIEGALTSLDTLAGARSRIDAREIKPPAAQGVFNGVNDSMFRMFSASAAFGDEAIDREIRALTSIGRGQEYLSRADALLGGAYVVGNLTAEARTELLQAVGTSRFLLASAAGDLSSADQEAYQQVSTGSAATGLAELQDRLLTESRAGAAPPVPAEAWRQAYTAVAGQLRSFEDNAVASISDRTTPLAVDVLGRLAAAGLLGLVAVIASIVISVRIGRSIVGRLIRLRGEALEMAGERLPKVIRRLQRGESVDVDVETPPLEYGNDEIGQVGHAFNEVQHTAVHSAVEEANVRRGINEVFLNIARRSQTLLHRQLALLDKMERRETDSQELEDLYRVDHLATRMRRHAEDLVILAGAAPGRGWRNPVPVIDVVRGSISEVEDYKRVDILSVESSSILGRAVGDLIHLLAELLENAASFSPPTTRVTVVGQILPNGYAIEIEDRGLGMSSEAIAETNRKLIEPPDFDPADSARLGLFVVAQLAGRQGIRVSLRPSAYGGITAVVLVPGELVTASPAAPPPKTPPPGKATPSLSSLQSLVGGPSEKPHISTKRDPSEPEPEPFTATRSSTGPTPSTVLDALSADGLVQRRRTVRRTDVPFEPPTPLPPNLTSPAELTPPHGLTLPPVRNGAVHGDGLDVDWPSGSDRPTGFDPRILTRGTGLVPPTPGTPVLPPRRDPEDLPPRRPEDLPPRRSPEDPPSRRGPEDSPSRRGLEDPPSRRGSGELPSRGGSEELPARGGPEGLPARRRPGRGSDDLDTAPVPPLPSGAPTKPPVPATSGKTPRASTAPPAPTSAPVSDEALLPRRVRQASLAPQLRGPVVERDEMATPRSPEEVRSIMSALQSGTNRGRRDAASLAGPSARGKSGKPVSKRPDSGSDDIAGAGDRQSRITDKQQTTGQPTWTEAATVTFPAVENTADGTGGDTDGRPEAKQQIPRPEKDA